MQKELGLAGLEPALPRPQRGVLTPILQSLDLLAGHRLDFLDAERNALCFEQHWTFLGAKNVRKKWDWQDSNLRCLGHNEEYLPLYYNPLIACWMIQHLFYCKLYCLCALPLKNAGHDW